MANEVRDWRSGHYGADKLAHLFVWGPWGGTKRPACGIEVRSVYSRQLSGRACPACLASCLGDLTPDQEADDMDVMAGGNFV